MGHVFISYSRNDYDSAFVSLLTASYLSKWGIEYWRDIEYIRAGEEWDTAIHYALKGAERLLLVMSPESMASPNVHDEWAYAIEQKIPIIPVYLRECEIHFRLRRREYIDFRTSANRKEAFQKLAAALKEPIEPHEPEIISDSPKPHLDGLKSENWHIRWDALDTLLKMASGAGLYKLLSDLLSKEQPSTHTLTNEYLISNKEVLQKWFITQLKSANSLLEKQSIINEMKAFNLFIGANLHDMDLKNMDFSYADLRNANLMACKLDNANFQNADLRGANLTGYHEKSFIFMPSVTNTDMRDAALEGADLDYGNWSDAIPPDGIVPMSGNKNWSWFINRSHPKFWQPEWTKSKCRD